MYFLNLYIINLYVYIYIYIYIYIKFFLRNTNIILGSRKYDNSMFIYIYIYKTIF